MTTEFERQEGSSGGRSPRKDLERRCDAYLKSLHCTLWGENFHVIHPAGRKKAVAWLADTLEGLAAIETKPVDGHDVEGK